MDKGTFDKLIASPVDISSQEVSQLEDLLASFPYCQVAHLLVAKESHDKKSMLYPQKLRKASTYALDRRVLYNVINRKAYHEKVVIHTPTVSVPEKKTTYESLPKSVNNQNSSFLRELEDNLKLLKEQTKKHDFTEVEDSSTLEETEPKVVAYSDKTENMSIKDALSSSQTLKTETPITLVEIVEKMDGQPLLENLQDKRTSDDPIVKNTEAAVTSLLDQTEESEKVAQLNISNKEEDTVQLDDLHEFQSLENEATLTHVDLEKDERLLPLDAVPSENTLELSKKDPENYWSDISSNTSHEVPINREEFTFEDNTTYVYKEEETILDATLQSFEPESATITHNQPLLDEKIESVEPRDNFDPLAEPKQIDNELPIVKFLDFPQSTIVETKLGTELSHEASSGTEEIELFLAYLRKNAPIKAPAEVQNKIIDKFIETQPKITRHPNLNFGQDNEDLAKSSISLRTELVTENYANILVKQNNIAKAIEVYKKLILKNPDKSAYFAAKLYELQSR